MARAVTSYAYKMEPAPLPPRRKPQAPKKVKKAVDLHKLRRTLLGVLVSIFSVALVIGFRYTVIYGQGANIAKMTAKLQQLETENQQLRLDIEKKIQLKNIEEFASKELGMIKPNKHQFVYITPSGKDVMQKKSGNKK